MKPEPPVLIVAHGQPSDPGPAALALAGFADEVSAFLPGRRVGSATLAEVGGLEAAALALGDGAVVFPMFMAGGWFTRVSLPARLTKAGANGWTVLEPFGCEPSVQALAAVVVLEALAGQDPTKAEAVIAAHGSFKSRVPSDIAKCVAEQVRRAGVGRVEVGFIDQDPTLASLTSFGPEAVCLPYFAAAGGHVVDDIPQALGTAGFQGRLLPPLGLDQRVPALVAAAIRRAVPACANTCRHQRGD